MGGDSGSGSTCSVFPTSTSGPVIVAVVSCDALAGGVEPTVCGVRGVTGREAMPAKSWLSSDLIR